MTNWIIVCGTQAKKPVEFDIISSKVCVYQHRNVERISKNTEQGSYEYWQYEERKMSFEEYNNLMLQRQNAQLRADIDYISAIFEIDL